MKKLISAKQQVVMINYRFIALVMFSLSLLYSFNLSAADDSVCARVKIEIQQEVTLERQAFDAHMRINNGLDIITLENVDVDVRFTDEDGNTILASSDPNNTDALFFITLDTMDNIANVDGQGIVDASTSADIHWLIIPAPGASNGLEQGTLYYVGATLSYTIGGEENVTEVSPDYIFVKPMPELTLDYFLPGDVYADDAFTPEIEPSVPFSLGVRVLNSGDGTAKDLKIDSAQPEITENEQGLLIGFVIEGSEVNGQPATPSLLADFGDIESNTAGMARWIMACSLSGQFVEIDATFSHSDELGGELTSLLEGTNTHFLVRDVLVDLPGRDTIRDFLALDGGVYRVYESTGSDTVVTDQSTLSSLLFNTQVGTEMHYSLSASVTAGSMYVKLSDPHGGTMEIAHVVRSDGKQVKPDNAWLSQSRKEDNTWEYFINLFDVNTTGAYTIVYNNTVGGTPMPPVMQFITDQTGVEDQQISFIVEASDPNGTIPELYVPALPVYASFTDQGDGTGVFDWTPIQGQAGAYGITFRASDGSLEDSRYATITICPVDDSDCDGMLDAWEMLHFNTLDRDGTGDFDGDGISDMDEFLYEMDPARSNYAPTTPVIQTPVNDEVATVTPALVIENSSDPDGDAITYDFEVFSDSGFTTMVDSGLNVEETPTTTSWTATVALNENKWYFFRVRATDGDSYSLWAYGTFFVNMANDQPGAFNVSSPADNTNVDTLAPVLEVTNSADVDEDVLTYVFEVYEDINMSILAASSSGIAAGAEGTTSWTVDTPLIDNMWYYWRVVVSDEDGEQAETALSSLMINLSNQAPQEPVISSPLNESEVDTPELDLVVNNVGDAINYYFELDKVDTFDGQSLQTSGIVSPGTDTTQWHITGLDDNTTYFWRVKASDGSAESIWTYGTFFVNAANNSPETPTINNPGYNSWSGTQIPTLAVNPGNDSDNDISLYRFEVYSDPELNNLVVQADVSTQQWTVPSELENNKLYYWRAQAEDDHGAVSDWTETTFFVVSGNESVPGLVTLKALDQDGLTPVGATVEVRIDGVYQSFAPETEVQLDVGTTYSVRTVISGITGSGVNHTITDTTREIVAPLRTATLAARDQNGDDVAGATIKVNYLEGSPFAPGTEISLPENYTASVKAMVPNISGSWVSFKFDDSLIEVNPGYRTATLVAWDQNGDDVAGATIKVNYMAGSPFVPGTNITLPRNYTASVKAMVPNISGSWVSFKFDDSLIEVNPGYRTATLVARDQNGDDVTGATIGVNYMDGSPFAPGTEITLPRNYTATVKAMVPNISGSWVSVQFTDELTEVNPGYQTATLVARDQNGDDVVGATIGVNYMDGSPFAPGTNITLPENYTASAKAMVPNISGSWVSVQFTDELTEVNPGYQTATLVARDQNGDDVVGATIGVNYMDGSPFVPGTEITLPENYTASVNAQLGNIAGSWVSFVFEDGLVEVNPGYHSATLVARDQNGDDAVGATIGVNYMDSSPFAPGTKITLPENYTASVNAQLGNIAGSWVSFVFEDGLVEVNPGYHSATLVARDQDGDDVVGATIGVNYIDGSPFVPGTKITLPVNYTASVNAHLGNIAGSWVSFVFDNALVEVNPGYHTATLVARDQNGDDVAGATVGVNYMDSSPFAPGTKITLPENYTASVNAQLGSIAGSWVSFVFDNGLVEVNPGYHTATLVARDQNGVDVVGATIGVNYMAGSPFAPGTNITLPTNYTASVKALIGEISGSWVSFLFEDGLVEVNPGYHTATLVARDQNGDDVVGATIGVNYMAGSPFVPGTEITLPTNYTASVNAHLGNISGSWVSFVFDNALVEVNPGYHTATLVARDQNGVDVVGATIGVNYMDGSPFAPGTNITLPENYTASVKAIVPNISGSWVSFLFEDGLTEVNPGYHTATLVARDQNGVDVVGATIGVNYMDGSPFAPGTNITLPENYTASVKAMVPNISSSWVSFLFEDGLVEVNPGYHTATLVARDQNGDDVVGATIGVNYMDGSPFAPGTNITLPENYTASVKAIVPNISGSWVSFLFEDGLVEVNPGYQTAIVKCRDNIGGIVSDGLAFLSNLGVQYFGDESVVTAPKNVTVSTKSKRGTLMSNVYDNNNFSDTLSEIYPKFMNVLFKATCLNSSVLVPGAMIEIRDSALPNFENNGTQQIPYPDVISVRVWKGSELIADNSNIAVDETTGEIVIETSYEWQDSYTITASVGTGGSISPSGDVTVITYGDETFSVIADIGFEIEDVLVDASSLGPVSSYTFSNVIDDHTISASFTEVEVADITISPTTGLTTTESGGIATFTVVLDMMPGTNVYIGLNSNNVAEGTVSHSSLTFTTTNWNIPQTVTVTGVDDPDVDGDIAYNIVTAPATSTDISYEGLNPSDIGVTNTDDDYGVSVVNPLPDQVTEDGDVYSFTIPSDTFLSTGPLSYSASIVDDTSLPGWLGFDSSSQTFSGTPADTDRGLIDIKVTATIGTEEAYDIFSLTVIRPSVLHLDSVGSGVIDTDDNGALDRWTDLSGTGNDSYQTDENIQPLIIDDVMNGHRAIKFDGVDDVLSLDDAITLNTGGPYTSKTLMIAFRTGADVSSRQVLYEQGDTGRGLNIFIEAGTIYMNGWNLSETAWGPTYITGVVTANTDYVATLVLDSASGILSGYLNLVSLGSVSGLFDLYAHIGDIGLGGIRQDSYFQIVPYSGDGEYFGGWIGEFVYFNDVLSTEELTVLRQALSAKWLEE